MMVLIFVSNGSPQRVSRYRFGIFRAHIGRITFWATLELDLKLLGISHRFQALLSTTLGNATFHSLGRFCSAIVSLTYALIPSNFAALCIVVGIPVAYPSWADASLKKAKFVENGLVNSHHSQKLS
jgi:hypothetical protein